MMPLSKITSAKWLSDAMTGEAQVCVRAVIDGVQWDVPKDADNSHYQEIMRQVEAGTLTIQDAD